MFKKLKSTKDGFTIIEVLIVLAIAALILLIVFLAVPALQRNARNTQRRNDVAGILGGVNEFSSDNNGAQTNKCSGTTTITWDTVAAGSTTAQTNVGYYNQACAMAAGAQGTVFLDTSKNPIAANTFNAGSFDYVDLQSQMTCSGNASIPGSARSWAAVYEIENGPGKFAQQCQAS